MGKLLILIILVLCGYVGWLYYKGEKINLPKVSDLASLVSSSHQEGTWLASIPDAKNEAKSQKKPVFVLFTSGDNSSGTSTQFDEAVINREEFMAYAKKRFILVKIDYSPIKQKTKSEWAKQHDDTAAVNNRVTGFPHMIVINTEGIKVEDIGYAASFSWVSSPGAFIQELESRIQGKPAIPEFHGSIPTTSTSISSVTPAATPAEPSPAPSSATPAPAKEQSAEATPQKSTIVIEGYGQ